MAAQWVSILNGNGGVEVSSGLEGHMYAAAGYNPAGPAPDQWHRLDLAHYGIPADAKCVDVSGVLIITMGSNAGYSELGVAFRRPGDESVLIRGHYVFQCSATTGSGMRSTAATVLSPVDGAVEWGWFWRGNTLGWPVGPAVGVNLAFTRWMR